MGVIRDNDVILFQGDSITDTKRARDRTGPNDLIGMGHGYVLMITSSLLADRPGDNVKCYNRGISGNKIWELEELWKTDCLDLKPDVLSILIGVNDTWHGQRNPELRVPLDRYERIYRKLLDEVKRVNQNVRLVLCEPFTLRTGVVTDSWFPEIDQRRAIVKRIAGEYRAVFVDFQSMFDEAATRAPEEYWLGDGVHPTLAGHQQMARKWLNKVNGHAIET